MADPTDKLRDENAELKKQLAALNADKTAREKAEAEENKLQFWNCSYTAFNGPLDYLNGVKIKAAGRGAATLEFCKRMGIRYQAMRDARMKTPVKAGEGKPLSVSADEITARDLELGALPEIGVNRINLEPIGPDLPPIEDHVLVHPNSGNRQMRYSAKELAALGYPSEVISQVI